MTTTHLNPTVRTSLAQSWTNALDGLRQRRQTAAARRELERQLASYTTNAEVNDLLASLQGQDEASVDVIREIVVENVLASQR
ncbi:hypothetical protein [Nocardioides pacificus]